MRDDEPTRHRQEEIHITTMRNYEEKVLHLTVVIAALSASLVLVPWMVEGRVSTSKGMPQSDYLFSGGGNETERAKLREKEGRSKKL